MSETAVRPLHTDTSPVPPAATGFRWWRNPWRNPWFLKGFTWLYLAWSILPVAIAVWFSFNVGRSRSSWQGFSLRWYYKDPVLSVWHDPDLHTALFQTIRLAVLTTVIAPVLPVLWLASESRASSGQPSPRKLTTRTLENRKSPGARHV